MKFSIVLLALFLPAIQRISKRLKIPMSKLLMPIAENGRRRADQVFLAMFPNW